MKKISNILWLVMSLFILFSCEDMMDVHKDFIKNGEKTYAPKVDSVMFLPGKGRIQFKYWIYDSPGVKSIVVYWNGGTDSLKIPINRTGTTNEMLVDSGSVIIGNLSEGSYTFSVKSFDSYGNSSLKVNGFANSYGENYEASLKNRRVKAISQFVVDGDAVIDWYIASEEIVRGDVRYVKKDGTKAIVSLPASGNTLSCPEARSDNPFEYRTYFLPEPDAIDTFVTEWSYNKIKFPYDRSGWEVVDVSDEQVSDGGGVVTILDGIVQSASTGSNFWHSSWSPVVPLPHWAVIDMQEPRKLAMIDTYRRWNNNSTRSVEYYIANEYTPGKDTVDFSEWTKITEGIFDDNYQIQRLVLEVSDGINDKGRYLLVYLPDSNKPQSTQISEIYVCGNSDE